MVAEQTQKIHGIIVKAWIWLKNNAVQIGVIVAIIGVIATIAVPFATNYSQTQTEKKDMAAQLYIEIFAKNRSLVPYYMEYESYTDMRSLSSDGTQLVGTTSNGFALQPVFSPDEKNIYLHYTNNGSYYEDDAAGVGATMTNGVLTRIPAIGLPIPNNQVKNNQIVGSFKMTMKPYCILDYPIIPGPIYNEHGMYYIYTKDISMFDGDLPQNLYTYYSVLTDSESNREYIQSYLDMNPNAPLNGQYFIAYMDMRSDIIRANQLAPTILTELSNEMGYQPVYLQ